MDEANIGFNDRNEKFYAKESKKTWTILLFLYVLAKTMRNIFCFASSHCETRTKIYAQPAVHSTSGYNDFDKTEPPRPEIYVKWHSRSTFIIYVFRFFEPFRPILSLNLAKSARKRERKKCVQNFDMGIIKRKIWYWILIHWKKSKNHPMKL